VKSARPISGIPDAYTLRGLFVKEGFIRQDLVKKKNQNGLSLLIRLPAAENITPSAASA